jgi:two-component system, OmpR family, sensor kinase
LSLRLRLALFGAAVVALTLLLFGSLLYALLARSVNSNQDDALRSRAGQAAASLGAEMAARAPVAPSDLRSSTDVFIEVLALDGTVLYSSAVLDGAPPAVPDRLRIAAEGASGGTFATVGDASKGTQLRLYAVRSSSDVVVAGQSTRVPASNLSGVVTFLTISAVPALLAALAASWLVAGRALRPLREVAATADEIGRTRDFGRRLAARRNRDEVSILSASFNRMLVSLEDAFESQRRFVADASHELRTPLTTIRGNADLLAHGPTVPEEVRAAAAHDIASESERMSRLVEHLLTLAQADAGQNLTLAPIALRPIIESVGRQAQAAHEDRRIRTVGLTDATVNGDEDAITQLLWILVDNAVKFTKPGGSIEVGLQQHDSTGLLTVADDGSGIPLGDLPRIFERFYQADAARSNKGAGLGLSIAQWIVDQHHGTIAARNNNGPGSTFSVALPLA